MENQELQSSPLTPLGKVPENLQERFLIKRINEPDIEISLRERDGILKALSDGQKFVQVRKYTLMLNSLKGIDPKWGEKNIPPRPKEKHAYKDQGFDKPSLEIVTNQDELDEWDKYYNNS